MKKYIIIVIGALLSACSNSKPNDVLDRNQMASILIEMYINESKINELGVRADSVGILNQIMLKQTLEQKNVSEDVYVKSYDYYINHLKRFEEVYSIVIDSLKVRESHAQQKAEQFRAERAKLDSLARLDTLVLNRSDSLFIASDKKETTQISSKNITIDRQVLPSDRRHLDRVNCTKPFGKNALP